jgi:pimeloyl-ACP methyl ester carboxylesterase
LPNSVGRWWPKVRRVWAALGACALLVFLAWMGLAFRATPDARAALQGNERVRVERGESYWLFRPAGEMSGIGLLFFPGALVEVAAYAPLARDVAAHGRAVLIVELPRRGGFGGADSPEVLNRTHNAMRQSVAIRRWVVAGHSRGGVVAARMVHDDPSAFAGLVLIGTSHPRDFSLANLRMPVTRVYGTRDTVADVEKLDATRGNLPAATRMVAIEGGNHSQFGYYGFQPGDWFATIDRDTQQRLTRQAIVETLEVAVVNDVSGLR